MEKLKVTPQSMTKELLNSLYIGKNLKSISNAEQHWDFRGITVHVYATPERKDVPSEIGLENCVKLQYLIQWMGYDTHQGIMEYGHNLKDLIEETKVTITPSIQDLISKYGSGNIATINSEKKLTDEQMKFVTNLIPEVWYIGINKFDDNNNVTFEPV